MTEAPQNTMVAPQQTGTAELLIHINAAQSGSLTAAIEHVSQSLAAFTPDLRVAITYAAAPAELAAPQPLTGRNGESRIQLLPYAASTRAGAIADVILSWMHTAADYAAALKVADACEARACIMLGPQLETLETESIPTLAEAVLAERVDLVMPCYRVERFEALLNSAVLYPLTRALHGRRVRFPLGADLAMSRRMMQRVRAVLSRMPLSVQDETLLWPATEAAMANLEIAEVELGMRRFAQGDNPGLSELLSRIVGSLFADAEVKAAAWQRVRQSQPVPVRVASYSTEQMTSPPDVRSMLESFQVGAGNLQEIWSLVLPPNSLLALKKLERLPSDAFRMPDALWARIVYDFMLAHRLRTISRQHLLGALTPLYLGWVASYVMGTGQLSPASAEGRVESLAAVFESEKPYLLSRWRWPDRFNP